VAVAAPGPIFGMLDQTTCDWVSMDVTEFLDELAFAENVEVVIARLPERVFGTKGERSGYGLFQGLHYFREGSALGFVDQHVDVFGHDYVSVDTEVVVLAGSFQGRFEGVAGLRSVEVWATGVTTESQEVKLSGLLIALESLGHSGNLAHIDGSCL
jgi:hypothetical protein